MSKNSRPSNDKSKSTDPDQCLRRTASASRPCFKYLWKQQRDEQDKAAYQRHCAERLASVYNGNTTQAILFLKAIKANNREPMQPFTIREHPDIPYNFFLLLFVSFLISYNYLLLFSPLQPPLQLTY
jgi:hypothetical protein